MKEARRTAQRPCLFLVFGLVLLGNLFTRGATAELFATRLTSENVAALRVRGPDADAGIDDWVLGNGTICAAISDPCHESPLTPQGGVLIDLGHCGAANDQWTALQPTLNLSQSHLLPVHEIEAGRDSDRAWIRTKAIFEGIEFTTIYSVDERTPNALDLRIEARRIAAGDRLFSIGAVLLHPSGQTRPFSLLRADLSQSVGFVYPASDRRSPLSLLRSLVGSDLTVLVGGDEMPPISYGYEQRSTKLHDAGEIKRLSTFSITGKHYTFMNVLTRPFWIGEDDALPGLFQFAQLPFMDIEAESEFVSEFRIWVGDRADVASITDQIWTDAPHLRGSVDDPSARIHIDLATGAPVTEIRPDASGAFSARLPVGRYRARIVASAGRSTTVDFEMPRDRAVVQLDAIELASPGWVRLPPSFIGRLVFRSEEDSDAARFGDDELGFRVGAEVIPSGLSAPFLNLAGAPDDPLRVALKPGLYRVLAVRGPEYEAIERRIEVQSGEVTTLEIPPLARVVQSPGWIAADLHVHSGESFDSSLPATRQIAAFAASGAEVLVATEHDRIFDPRPAIRHSGLEHELVSITGVEATSAYQGGDAPFTSGHFNAFPMEPRPDRFRGGAPRFEGRRLRDAMADLRTAPSPPFIQLNHPRPAPGESNDDTYFEHLGPDGQPYDPTRPLSAAPNRALVEASPDHGLRDLDYDGVELMNEENLVRYREMRADWFSLLLQGEARVATANSDSHRLGAIVGLPRTYVRLADDSLTAFDEDLFLASLHAGHVYGSTGPLLGLLLDETGIGDLHSGRSGTLHLRVDAAPWVPVREWRVYVNGELVHRAPIAADAHDALPMTFERDAFVTVEVEGPAEGLYRDVLPDFTPFAFTNPIFVDVDGNGRFDPPGFPESLPQTLRDPDIHD
jgi:hypothetical protein